MQCSCTRMVSRTAKYWDHMLLSPELFTTGWIMRYCQKPTTKRIINARFHSKCTECHEPVVPGMEVVYTPSNGISKATVQHIEGQCPDIMDYAVQLVYRCTSKLLKIRALSADEAIVKATPKRTARETDSPCGYIVRQGNIEVLRRMA